jgi:hypothetical protein
MFSFLIAKDFLLSYPPKFLSMKIIVFTVRNNFSRLLLFVRIKD